MQTTAGLAKGNCSFIFRSVAVICSASLCAVGGVRTIRAQSAVEEQIVVTGEEVPSAYGAPPGFSRSRFSNLTGAYVLPPGGVYVAPAPVVVAPVYHPWVWHGGWHGGWRRG